MKLKLTLMTLLIVMLVVACGPSTAPEPTPDVAAVRTSAASTVVSEFTLTAAVFTPTPFIPTETPLPPATAIVDTATATNAPVAQVTNALGTTVALCDSLSYVEDVTIPDGSILSPGEDFIKTWRVKNTGSCPWGDGYQLVYANYSNKMSGQFQPLTQVVQPGDEVEVSVQFKAPDAAGEYLSAWQMRNPAGVTFEDIIFVKIVVQ